MGSGDGLYIIDSLDVTVTANVVRYAGTGLLFDAGCQNCLVTNNSLRDATTPLSIAGSGHRIEPGVPALQTVATTTDFSLTAGSSPLTTIHTGTLTANCTITLASGFAGSTFRVARSGGGTGTLSVGGVKSLTTGQWVEVTHDGSSWKVTGFGAL